MTSTKHEIARSFIEACKPGGSVSWTAEFTSLNEEAAKLVKNTPRDWPDELTTDLYRWFLQTNGVHSAFRGIKGGQVKLLETAARLVPLSGSGSYSGLRSTTRDLLFGRDPTLDAFRLRLKLKLAVARHSNIPGLAKKATKYQSFADDVELMEHVFWVLAENPPGNEDDSILQWACVFLQMLNDTPSSWDAVDALTLDRQHPNARIKAFVANQFVRANRKSDGICAFGARLRAVFSKEWLEVYPQ